jgi:hypothetical protein
VVGPAREGKVVESAASTLEPSKMLARAGSRSSNCTGRLVFSLDNYRPGPNPTAAYEVAGPDLDDVAAAQLAVDFQVEHGPVANAPILVEPEPDRPDLLRFERALCTEFPTLRYRASGLLRRGRTLNVPWPSPYRRVPV